MNKYLYILALILFFPVIAVCAPSISSVSGTYTDGQTITISGTDFGSHGLDIEWIGDDIEATTNGQMPTITDWIFSAGGMQNVTVSTAQAHSGTKALYSYYTNWAGPNSAATRFDYGSNIAESTDVYVTWWTRWSYTQVGSNPKCQWKQFRLNYQNDITDDYPQWVMFNWDGAGTGDKSVFVRPGPDNQSNVTELYPGLPAEGAWYRMEAVLNTGTVGASDGSITINTMLPGSAIDSATDGTTMFYYSGTRRLRWFLWQNYAGDYCEDTTMWVDDPYIQVGSIARVELGNASTWAASTSRDIQIPTSWSTTSVQATFNSGAQTGSAWLYVVKSDGTVNSSGYEITVGGGDTTPPTFSSASVNSVAFTLNFSEDVVTTGYDSGDCVVTGSSTGAHNITSFSGSGSSRTATLASGVGYGETVTLSCTLGTDDVEDASGNDMITFADTSVMNNTPLTGFKNIGSSLIGCKIE